MGGRPRVTDLWTTGPATKSPSLLMEESSTVSAAMVPGFMPCSARVSAQSVGVGVASTAVITCATWSTPDDGEPAGTP